MICRPASGGPDSTEIVISSIKPINFMQFLIRSSDGSWGRIVFPGEIFMQKILVRLSTLNMNVHIVEKYNFSTVCKKI